MLSATAISHPNIAFIKYWGNRNHQLRIPANSSLSVNLEGLFTRTKVTYDSNLEEDTLFLNNELNTGKARERVSAHLDRIRAESGMKLYARVDSVNNFPMGAGIASSASAFASLTLAGCAASKMRATERELSRLARLGSGSACRSIPGGFVEWQAGQDDHSSYAFSIAPRDYWDIVDCIAIVSSEHKPVTSTEGHVIAETSVLQDARVADSQRRVDECRQAILERDIERLAEVSEMDCNMMHAVMMTSSPALIYWEPTTLVIMQAVIHWRRQGIPVFYTIDAGPNVHVLCLNEYTNKVKAKLMGIPGVKEVLTAKPGGPGKVLDGKK